MRKIFFISFVIFAINIQYGSSQNTSVDLPQSWTMFVPVDASSLKMSDISKIPVRLKGVSDSGKVISVAGRQVSIENLSLDFTMFGEKPKEKKCGLLLANMVSDFDQKLRVGAGADWWMEWYVNGGLAYSTLPNGNNTGNMAFYNHVFELPLKKGNNLIAVKVLSGSGSQFKIWLGGPTAFKAHEKKVQSHIDSIKMYRPKQFYPINTEKWLYFGWEEDHPKSWAFMGGAVGPGQAYETEWAYMGGEGSAQNTNPKFLNEIKPGQIIQYVIKHGGKTFVPDEFSPKAKERIKWNFRDGYMPCPMSEWFGGHVKVNIQHFANRVHNNSATAVYSKVSLTNTGNCTSNVRLLINANADYEVPLSVVPTYSGADSMYFDIELNAGETRSIDFVAKANGIASPEELRMAGGFDANYALMAAHYNTKIEKFAHPVHLPVPEMVNMYKYIETLIWQNAVKDNGDVVIRSSAYNPAGLQNYDTPFTHDLPFFVGQLIRIGDYDLAKKVLESKYYKSLNNSEVLRSEGDWSYRDYIGMYILPYADYLQATGDTAYFVAGIIEDIKKAACNINASRERDEKGNPGLFKPSSDFENWRGGKGDRILADNWSGLHGLQAYKNICDKLGMIEESVWAYNEMTNLNESINSALMATSKRLGIEHYLGAFDDETFKNYITTAWVPYSAALSSFPWGAYLKGYSLGGFWSDKFDESLKFVRTELNKIGLNEHSWGTWWLEERYGTAYNASAGIQCLFSDEYRTEGIKNVEFLLHNQCSPFQWSESFDFVYDDWNVMPRPHISYGGLETWAYVFINQCLLQSCISVKTDNTVIIGRGIPGYWVGNGKIIEWANVNVNNNKKIGFKITATHESVTLTLTGDSPDGKILFCLPTFVNNIKSVSSGEVNQQKGEILLDSNTKSVTVHLKNKLI